MSNRMLRLAALLVPAILSVGCATQSTTPYNYSAFEASNPHSILVLPPVNNSPDVKATFGVYAQVTHPLAEAGYYVLPVAVVNETFKQNGLTQAADIHNVDPKKLQQIFGADAALYLTITQYGSSYNVVSSVVTVGAEAKLVDLRTGALLWNNKVVVVDNGNQNSAGGGLLGALVQVAVTQILNSTMDKAYIVARTANERLLSGGQVNGLLYGPRSPSYKGRIGPRQHTAPAVLPVATASTSPVAVPVSQTSSTPALVAAPVPAPAVVPAPAPVTPAPAPMAPRVTPAAPVATASPLAAFVPQAVAAPAPPPSGAEQRYAEVLQRARAQNAALDPASNWYRSELVEWVMERKAEFIGTGLAPDVALQRAVALLERR
jgi:hypothetical protein